MTDLNRAAMAGTYPAGNDNPPSVADDASTEPAKAPVATSKARK